MLNKKMTLLNFIALNALIAIGSVFFFTSELNAQTQKAVQDSTTTLGQSPVGYWRSVDFVENIDEFVLGQKKTKNPLYIMTLSCYENGQTSNGWMWKDGQISFNDPDGTVSSQYFMKAMNDTTYLFYPWLVRFIMGYDKPAYYVLKKISDNPTDRQNNQMREISVIDNVEDYGDVRWKDLSNLDLSERLGLIETLAFNENTVWPDNEKLPSGIDPKKMLVDGMNPGLGIRGLHKEGITGKGINVAIIDQPLFSDHPEFTGKIALFKDFVCLNMSSMHGPAVSSLLVGTNCGTAPEAKLYYAAVPSWETNAEYYAKALDWIIEKNEELMPLEKIRVVSVSAAPSGRNTPYSNPEMWDDACARAEAKNILVLDCTNHRGLIAPCYCEGNSREDVSKYKVGFPGQIVGNKMLERILVPCADRTVAEEYILGQTSYAHDCIGGLSWSIPYCAGVLALGWQLRPELTSVQMKDILFQSAYINDVGNKIINPGEFIKMVKAADFPSEVKDNKTGQFQLNAPYPNPFNPSTVISYQIPEETDINLTIFNTNGQKVNTLVDGIENSGSHSVVWNGTDSSGRQLASGIYLYRLKAGDFLKTEKMTFLR